MIRDVTELGAVISEECDPVPIYLACSTEQASSAGQARGQRFALVGQAEVGAAFAIVERRGHHRACKLREVGRSVVALIIIQRIFFNLADGGERCLPGNRTALPRLCPAVRDAAGYGVTEKCPTPSGRKLRRAPAGPLEGSPQFARCEEVAGGIRTTVDRAEANPLEPAPSSAQRRGSLS